jgi:hypothetical protein
MTGTKLKKTAKLRNLHKSEALKSSSFSHANLTIFAIIFAAIGGYFIYSSFAAPAVNPPYSLGCETGATNVTTAAQVRSEVSAGHNVCVTADVGNVDLSSIKLSSNAFIGTNGGSMGAVSMVGSNHIDIRQARLRSIDIRDSQFITIEKSTLGGTSTNRVMDNLITSLGYTPGIDTSNDLTIADNEIAWTTADSSGNTGYGIRVYGGDRLRILRNSIHNIGADGIQMGSDGADNVIDRNEISYIAPPTGSSEHSDNIQVTGNGPNFQITNNWFHHQGWYTTTQQTSNSGTMYMHGGTANATLIENNLFTDSLGRVEIAGLGTGGTSRSNITIRSNTFNNLGTAFSSFPGFEWDVDSGSGNLVERNVAVDPDGGFAQDGLASTATFQNNLFGQSTLVTLDSAGNCTSTNCNPTGQGSIGYRCPTGVWWCDASGSVTPPPPPPPASGGSCSTTVSTVSAIQSAVSSAANGDIICVSSGSYGATNLTGGGSRTARAILRPASAAAVNFTARVNINNKHLEIQDITFSQASSESYYIGSGADDIIMRNDTAKHFVIKAQDDTTAPPKNIQILGGDVGNLAATSSDSGNIIGTNGGSTLSPQNILIDGVNFHDMTVGASSGFHMECLHVWAADSLTVRNSKFSHCSVFDVFIQRLDPAVSTNLPPAPQNITIENNFFNCCRHTGDTSDYKSFAIKFTSDYNPGSWNNITIRNNSSDDKFQLDTSSAVTYVNTKVYNNIAPAMQFNDSSVGTKPSGVNLDNNIWYNGSKIGSNDIIGQSTSSLFTNFAALDFHLKTGSPAIDKGNNANAPSTDIDGDSRPSGTIVDIGADETGGTSTPKPADIDKNGVVDITDLSYLLSSYGQTTTTCTTNSSFTCDIATTPSSTNGKIDIFDLSLLLSGYGK